MKQSGTATLADTVASITIERGVDTGFDTPRQAR